MNLKAWITLARPFTLPIMIVFFMLGPALAGTITYRSLVALIGVTFVLFGTHFFNAACDYISGADRIGEDTSKIYSNATLILPGMLVDIRKVEIASLIFSVLGGIILIYLNSLLIIPYLIGSLGGIIYSTHLKRWGLGELAMVVVYGIGLVMTGYIAETGEFSLNILPVALLPGMFMGLLYTIDQYQDVPADRKMGINNIAGFLEKKRLMSYYIDIWIIILILTHLVLMKSGFLPMSSCFGLCGYIGLFFAARKVDKKPDIGFIITMITLLIVFTLIDLGLYFL